MAYRLEAITLCTRGPVNTSAMRELWGDIEQGKLPILFDSEHNFAVGVSPVLKYSDYSVDDKSKFTLSILGVTKTFFYKRRRLAYTKNTIIPVILSIWKNAQREHGNVSMQIRLME